MQIVRTRVITALITTAALAMAVPTVAPAATKKGAKHCVKFKTYKSHGKSYKRCAKYTK